MADTYYELLGVQRGAGNEEIEVALRDKRRHWSRRASNAPRLEDRQEAERVMQELDEAERTLLDPAARFAYDNNAVPRSAGPPAAASDASPASSAAPAPEVTRLRVPATALFEAAQRQRTGGLGRTITRYEVHGADELVITDKRVVVLNHGDIEMQMELDPGLLAEAQDAARAAPEVTQVPFLGAVESKQHIFRMRRVRGNSLAAAGTGCLTVLVGYWFVIAALILAAVVGQAGHSAGLGVLIFVIAILAIRVRPRKTIVLRPLHAMPIAGGLMSALIRHAGAGGFGWEYEVEVASEHHDEVLKALEPAASVMQQVARRSSGF